MGDLKEYPYTETDENGCTTEHYSPGVYRVYDVLGRCIMGVFCPYIPDSFMTVPHREAPANAGGMNEQSSKKTPSGATQARS